MSHLNRTLRLSKDCILEEGPVINHVPTGLMLKDTAFSKKKSEVIERIKPYLNKGYDLRYFTVGMEGRDLVHMVRVFTDLKVSYRDTHNGFCRCYYTTNRKRLVCIQPDEHNEYSQYHCTKDGEPSYKMLGFSFIPWRLFPMPEGDTSTDKEVRQWLSDKNKEVNDENQRS